MIRLRTPERKPLHFVGASKKDLKEMPGEIQDEFGTALREVQLGRYPESARPFGEGLPREVMKLVEDYRGETYRAAYTVALRGAVYVLHVFQKKSSSGSQTPRPDKATILARLQAAREHHRRTYVDAEREQ